jgi:hypothetical protein
MSVWISEKEHRVGKVDGNVKQQRAGHTPGGRSKSDFADEETVLKRKRGLSKG